MTDEKFIRYAELTKQIANLEAQQLALKFELTEEMEKEDIQELKNDLGSFYFTTRKTWEYPEEVQQEEAKLKDMKKQAEESGEAIYLEHRTLGFRMAKEKIL